MQTERGVTLISATIYIIVMLIIVTIITVLTSYFYKNVDIHSATQNLNQQYTKFNSYFTEEVNKKGNKILDIQSPIKLEDEEGNAVTGAEGLAALEPWATGFYNALAQYSDRVTVNDAIEAQLCRIHRFLELDESDEDYEQNLAIRRGIEQAHPVRNLEEGMVEMMQGVIEIAKLNCPNKPISRSTPKVGRNDPCPCGSGKKYKNCCGKNA